MLCNVAHEIASHQTKVLLLGYFSDYESNGGGFLGLLSPEFRQTSFPSINTSALYRNT